MLIRPGRIFLNLRQKFGYGLRAAWYRDVVRPRILHSEPVTGTNDAAQVEVHVLTSAGDWLNLCWVLKSFYHFADVKWALCIHEDGTVPQEGIAALRRLFPDSQLIRRAEADAAVLPMLEERGFARCAKLRRTNVLSLKVFDFAQYLSAPRMLLLDSDVLFFARPDALLEELGGSDCVLNKDWRFGYTISIDQSAKLLGKEPPSLINSGLGFVNAGTYRLQEIERYLELKDFWSHPHRIEQTIVALESVCAGFHFLPREYDVEAAPRNPSAPVKHYTGPIRHLLYREGIAALRGIFV